MLHIPNPCHATIFMPVMDEDVHLMSDVDIQILFCANKRDHQLHK